MKLRDIPECVLSHARERNIKDEIIETMSAEELFTEYCNYEGLIGYGGFLFNMAVTLSKIQDGSGSKYDYFTN